MTIFFKSRTLARNFSEAKELKNGKVLDNGVNSPTGRRWAYRINKGA